jgi:hypothetical protein
MVRGVLVLTGLLSLAAAWAEDPKPPVTVTVRYRGTTQTLTGTSAQAVREIGLAILGAAGTERAATAETRQRYATAQQRSSVLITFDPPATVARPGQPAVEVASLLIPFSPDLDPETVYALPGQPFRALAEIPPASFAALRRVLVNEWIYPVDPAAVVSGVVRVEGELKPPLRVPLDEAMMRFNGQTHYTDETWKVGDDRGLANCVVTLRATAPANRQAPRPLAPTRIDRDGVCYVPRVLVVTPGTPVVLTNTEDSPCRGYLIQGARPQHGNQFNFHVRAFEDRTVVLKGPDVCTVTCPVRPYARAFIHVVDTPHFAVTDAQGRFTLRDLPLGDYAVTVWHEAAGRLPAESGPARITVREGEQAVAYVVPLPAERRK